MHDRSNPTTKPAELGPCPCGVDSPRHDPPTCASRMAPFLPPPVTAHALRLRPRDCVVRASCWLPLLVRSVPTAGAPRRDSATGSEQDTRHRAPPLRPPVVPVPVRAPPRAGAHVCIAFASRVATADGTDGGPGESPTGLDETWPLATTQCPSWLLPHVHWTLHPATCRLPYGQCSGSSMLCFQVVHVHWCFRSVLAASNWCRGCPLRPACTTATGDLRAGGQRRHAFPWRRAGAAGLLDGNTKFISPSPLRYDQQSIFS